LVGSLRSRESSSGLAPQAGGRRQLVFVGKFQQVFEAFDRIDAAGPPDFRQAFGTEFQWTAISFSQVIRAIHSARTRIRRAMRLSEHMSNFMRCQVKQFSTREAPRKFHGSLQDLRSIAAMWAGFTALFLSVPVVTA
jgi:hypothetical protein